MAPVYLIVAGVNGAGKSTLYTSNQDLFQGTRRLNADEWLRANGYDWRQEAHNALAMKTLVRDLKMSLTAGESIHQETTLSGAGQPFVNLVNKAKTNGYQVTLLYIYLDSPELAIERVAHRVDKGGHGVSDEVIRKRYETSLANFRRLADLVDQVKVYDNTDFFRLVYHRLADEILFQEDGFPLLD